MPTVYAAAAMVAGVTVFYGSLLSTLFFGETVFLTGVAAGAFVFAAGYGLA